MKNTYLALLLAATPLVLSGYSVSSMAHSEEQCGVELVTENIYKISQVEHKSDTKALIKAALGSQYDAPVAKVSESQLNAGSSIYTQTCAVCHGATGQGDGASSKFFPIRPADFTNVKESGFYSERAQLEIIKKGILGTQMPGWETALSEEDLLAVYGYVRSLRQK